MELLKSNVLLYLTRSGKCYLEDIPFFECLFSQLLNDGIINRVCCSKLGIYNPLLNFDPYTKEKMTIIEKLESWFNVDTLLSELDNTPIEL